MAMAYLASFLPFTLHGKMPLQSWGKADMAADIWRRSIRLRG
jgi:hypothetical protein